MDKDIKYVISKTAGLIIYAAAIFNFCFNNNTISFVNIILGIIGIGLLLKENNK